MAYNRETRDKSKPYTRPVFDADQYANKMTEEKVELHFAGLPTPIATTSEVNITKEVNAFMKIFTSSGDMDNWFLQAKPQNFDDIKKFIVSKLGTNY